MTPPRLFLLHAAVAMSTAAAADELLSLLGATQSPTISSDFWGCATVEVDQYFAPPQPTGEVSSALLDYGDVLLEACTLTGWDRLDCAFPEHSLWCGFASAAPTAVLRDYSAYGSEASEWLAEKSAGAVSAAEECPYAWWRLVSDPLGFGRSLNLTVAMARCYVDAQVTDGPALPTGTGTGTGTGTVGVAAGNSPEETSSSGPENGGLGRAGRLDMWVVGGTGLAAAVAAIM